VFLLAALRVTDQHDRPLPQPLEQPVGQHLELRDRLREPHARQRNDRRGQARPEPPRRAFVEAETGYEDEPDGGYSHPDGSTGPPHEPRADGGPGRV
jgi:hypothetical protein